MTGKKTVKYVLAAIVVLFELFSAFIVSGAVIQISGWISLVLWFIPIAVAVISVKTGVIYKEIAFLLLFIYLALGALFLIREKLPQRKQLYSWNENNEYHVVYEVNPGAMGHMSYEHITYYYLIDTKLLSVRIVEDKKQYKHMEGIPLQN